MLIPSGWARINLAVDIIAIDKSKTLRRFLGMGWESMGEQEKSRNQNAYHKPFSPHTIHL